MDEVALQRQLREVAQIVALLQKKEEGERFYNLYPAEGPFSRDKYAKHMEFFALGKIKPYVCMLGANAAGKSTCGGYETVAHLTGEYPDWWPGHRYTRPVRNWSAGVDFKSIRESMQLKLFGSRGNEGTGLIPREKIDTIKYGQNDVVDYALIKYKTGGLSRIVIKCYEQGVESFQAADVDDIWLDEEPDDPTIYTECTQRFRGETASGRIRMTFTPLFGVSDVVCMFLPTFIQNYDEAEYERSGRAHVVCTLDDVPHVSEEEKQRKIANTMPHEREARINGLPSIGEGKVYPFEESSFVINPVPGGLPRHWPRLYGLDPGKKCTAAAWGAHDRDDDIVYLYSEHYMGEQLPPVHAQAIKARGHWIPGVIDPAAKAGNAVVDYSILQVYTDPKHNLGLRLKMHQHRKGENGRSSVETGVLAVYERLSTGRLKVYRTMTHWLSEFRQYSRDKNQKIIKRNDHLMDATSYLLQNLRYAMLPHDDYTDRMAPKMQEVSFGIYG